MSIFFFFFFNDTATTEIYTLPLHDALPIYGRGGAARSGEPPFGRLELGEQRRRQALAVPAQILAQLGELLAPQRRIHPEQGGERIRAYVESPGVQIRGPRQPAGGRFRRPRPPAAPF